MERKGPPIGPKNWSISSRSRPRPRPSFITNREFVPSLIIFGVFFVLVQVVRRLATTLPNVGVVLAVATVILMAEWERRARFTFGRARQRARMDQLHLVKLPPHIRQKEEIEPETPFIDHEKAPSTPAEILKQARDTIVAGKSSDDEAATALDLVLVDLLKKALADQVCDKRENASGSETQPQP